MTTSQVEKDERLTQLVALCIKNHKTPASNAFADFVIMVCAGFGVNRRTARSYIDSLISVWRLDKWKSRVKENPYMTEEAISEWISQH